MEYVGSITIDKNLIDAVGMLPFEKVQVVSNTSGARLETYVIAGEAGSGVICMNGACSHLIRKGEEVIIMGYELLEVPSEPKIILIGKNNTIEKYL